MKPNQNSSAETVISVRHAAKKFCRNLKRSMAYGILDLSRNLFGMPQPAGECRKDEFWALHDVAFTLQRGRCLGLVGVNGSGKTTLLRLIAGIFPPDRGEIVIRGRVGALIALGAGFHPHMTGRENIFLNGSILGLQRREINDQFERIVAFAELEDFIDAPVATYSSGMRVRLGFSVAMAMRPDVLLIDEVLAVGDVAFKVKCLNAISELLKDTAVIFVSHSMQFVSRICTDIMVLKRGRVVHHGDDIGKGIDCYLSQCDFSKKDTVGSGKATVSGVRIVTSGVSSEEDGMPLLHYGSNLVCEMHLSAEPSVKRASIKMVVYDQEQRPLADCLSSHCGLTLNRTGGQSLIRLTCPDIRFNAGIYTVGIIVLDEEANDEILFRCDAMGSFQVAHSRRSWAPVLLQGEWTQDS